MSEHVAPSFQKTGMRCAKCDKPFRADLPVNCAIPVWVAASKALRCPFCGGKKLLFGEGRSGAEDAAERRLGPESAVADRAEEWLDGGEKGMSSETIERHMMGKTGTTPSHPHDADDLRRCVLLLRRIPEWVPRMHEMASVSPGWAALAPRWKEIADLLEEEAGHDLGGRAPRTYALMELLLSVVEA